METAVTRYISKGEWFDTGTEATLLVDCRPDGLQMGIFLGVKDGKPDEEDCTFDEFDIVEDNDCGCTQPCGATVGTVACQPGATWTPPLVWPALPQGPA
jgi:hypothetical protein